MKEAYSVLICDDNDTVQDCLQDYLTNEGFLVFLAGDGETALQIMRRQHIDLVVLDVMLPGMSGLEVCHKIRKDNSVPIIMLSAKGTVEDRVFGIESGADDYVTKPYSPWELTARIKRMLARVNAKNDTNAITFSDLILYPEENKVVIFNQKIYLTNKETKVLSCLASNAGRVCSREQLLCVAWGYEFYGDMRVVDTLIKRLRKKIMLDSVRFKITSIYSVGYQMEEDI